MFRLQRVHPPLEYGSAPACQSRRNIPRTQSSHLHHYDRYRGSLAVSSERGSVEDPLDPQARFCDKPESRRSTPRLAVERRLRRLAVERRLRRSAFLAPKSSLTTRSGCIPPLSHFHSHP